MTEKEDIISNLEAWQKAKAKSQAYKEFSDLVVKYNDKVSRQVNEAISKYKRIKDHGTNQEALYKAMDEMSVLKYKAIEVRELCIEFLQRSIDAVDAENIANTAFSTFSKQALEEEDSERELRAHSESEK